MKNYKNLLKKEKIHFYQSIGCLLYAIAASDNKIREEEINVIKKLIDAEWRPYESDEEAINQIKTTFILQVEKNIDAKDAFAKFRSYKEANEELFTEVLQKRIWKTVNTIAESVAGKNKSELVMLCKLSVLFKK